jgi:hypothetical protein
MKKRLMICFLVLWMGCLSQVVLAAPPVKIEVLYMNHGPLEDTLAKLRRLFSGFGNKVSVSWYDFESTEGEQFKASKGIHQHIPLFIWINGNSTAKIGRQEVTFSGFPSGAGPASFQGKWTIDNLKKAIERAIVLK